MKHPLNEVMRILKVSRNTLYRWNKDGYLKPVKVGGGIRYHKSDIEKLLNPTK